MSAYVAALSAPMWESRLDRRRIVPVIKDRQWINDVRAQVAQEAAANAPTHKVETFNNELVIVYAEDQPTRTRYIPAGEDIGIADGELRTLAVDNLRRMLPKISLEAHVDVGIVRVTAGGDYDASLLLLDELWSGGQIEVEGDIVVAVPASDVLLVTGSRSRTGLKVLRAMVADVVKGSHRLTDMLFVYRQGRFVRFGRS